MSVAYARRGLFGLLTPQANTTVEPEFGILTPPGYGFIAARLTSHRPTIEERLRDYLESIDSTLARFANAPIGAAAFACTGASYLLGAEREAELVDRIGRARGYRLLTAAAAIAAALGALGARRIGLVSPYDGALHEACLAYWESRGLELAGVARLSAADQAFHPIYALDAEAAGTGLDTLAGPELEAVVMLGTGLPTLPALERAFGGGPPVMSSNLCLAWLTVQALDGTAADRATLLGWLRGESWAERLRARMAAP